MKTALAILVALALIGAPAAGLAKPPGGEPPGLAKKPEGLPPGQAKKLYARGERLPLDYMQTRYYISQPSRYQLAPEPPGYRWVLIEDNAYLANTQSGLIANVIVGLLSR